MAVIRRAEVRAPVQPTIGLGDVLSILAGRVAPASFFLLVVLAKAQGLNSYIAEAHISSGWLQSAGFYAAGVHKLAAIIFNGLIVLFFVTRLNPVRRARNPVQIAVALTASFMMTLVAMAPETPTAPLLTVMAALIMVGGTVFTAAALACLGRSFSITPEARRLVTGGMYRVVRHPMYLGEMLGSFGMVLQALSPLTLLVFAAFCIMQVKRMDYEESVLACIFPDYVLYRRRTARLIPGIY